VHALEQPNSFSVALVDVVLAGGVVGGTNGVEVLAYLANRHPTVRRVLMAGNIEPWQLELARNTLFPNSVHRVLSKPWIDATLARALGG